MQAHYLVGLAGVVLALMPGQVVKWLLLGVPLLGFGYAVVQLGLKDGFALTLLMAVYYLPILFLGWVFGWFIRKRILKMDAGDDET